MKITSFSISQRFYLWRWAWLAGFAYSVAQGLVAELKSREEYESCNLSKPIKMYTDGLHTIPLQREGIRYFVSSEPENCKNGLKLHVQVLPSDAANPFTTSVTTVVADGPSTPSGSARRCINSILVLIAAMLCATMGLPH